MTQLALQVKDDISALLKSDKLVLPTLPEAALQVREVAEDVNSSIGDLVKIIARDPALTARIIKVSNSPLVRANSPVTDVHTAVARLGISFTSNLAIGLAMEQMFQATHDIIDSRMRACWTRSLEIASSAQVLARHFTRLPPEQALLAGLMHQIGILPILAYAETNEDLLADSFSLDLVIEKLHQPLGAYILRSWKFPAEIVLVAREYLKFDREVPTADFCDLVQVATLQSYDGTAHPLAKIDRNSVGAFRRLGLVSDGNVKHLEDLSEELEQSQSALMLES